MPLQGRYSRDGSSAFLVTVSCDRARVLECGVGRDDSV